MLLVQHYALSYSAEILTELGINLRCHCNGSFLFTGARDSWGNMI